ncbi:poly(R)-hydroxyalkanoic acid synthase subunit PhaE [Candidatus Magnetoovum chiemensis]|nr:poly(R)-hydroxyalkanoic acid synthase subunit PhaE [Candidatus Magnetoovum chiemensis]
MEGNPFFENMQKSQQEFMNNLMNFSKTLQSNLFSGFMPSGGSVDANKEMFNLYNSWLKTIGSSFDGLMKNVPTDVGKEAAAKLFKGFDSYVKVYEFWTPLFKAIEDKTFNPDSYKDLLDPSKYKSILDKIFGLSSTETATEFFSQASGLIDTWGGASQNFVKPWVEAMQNNIQAMSNISSMSDPNAMNLLHNTFLAFDKTIGKAFKTPQVGKDREKLELILRTIDAYSVYVAKNTVFQHKMYTTGEAAMRKVLEAVASKIKEGAEIKNYDEFYKIWTDINEKAYFDLFNSEDFSKVQGALLESALTFKKLYNQLIEINLSDFPIPVRSEMNDVYKTIYDLKRKVRTLENKLNELSKTPKEG